MNNSIPVIDPLDRQLIHQLERLAFRTWPAVETVNQGDWIMRRSVGGFTKRANSVWTAAGMEIPNGDWLEEAQKFYHSYGLTLRYHVSDVSPVQLDSWLEEKGFLKEVPCSMLTAETEQVIAHTHCSTEGFNFNIESKHDDQWLSNFLNMEGFDEEKRAFYDDLFSHIEGSTGFCTFIWDGQYAAVGTAVVEEGWAGLINIAVNPELRGKGIGTRLVNQLAQWSLIHGAHRMYLQVTDENEAAHRLYNKAGFTPHFRYHYRCENN
jgi:GNAT superfamily N-acetyltransferase